MEKYDDKLNSAYKIAVVLILCISMILVIANKQNIHVDEFMSYGLSNAKMAEGIDITFQDGVKYSPADEPYLNHMTVSEDGRFDFENVWVNQGRDVHPPLYYVLFHLISSIFTGSTSYWIPGSINIFFICLTLFVSYKLVCFVSEDKMIADIFLMFFAVSVGILNISSWMRMYAAAMFWCTLTTWLLIVYLEKETVSYIDCLKFIAAVVGGALTHYYCIIWAVFSAAVYIILMIMNKKSKNIVCVGISMLISGGISLLVFPAMWEHIFSGYRGEQAFDNLFNLGDLIQRLADFYEIVSKELFGGFLTILLIGIVVIMVLHRTTICERYQKKWMHWILLIIPSLSFFVLISKIAVWATDRYMFPVYAFFFATIIMIVLLFAKTILKRKKTFIIFSVLLLVLITVGGNYNARWEYLYLESKDYLEECKDYSQEDCLFIHDGCQWKAGPAYKEISNFKSVTFVNEISEIQHDDFENSDSLIVMIVDEDDKYIQEIMNTFPQLNNYRYIGEFGYTRTYLFENDKNQIEY